MAHQASRTEPFQPSWLAKERKGKPLPAPPMAQLAAQYHVLARASPLWRADDEHRPKPQPAEPQPAQPSWPSTLALSRQSTRGPSRPLAGKSLRSDELAEAANRAAGATSAVATRTRPHSAAEPLAPRAMPLRARALVHQPGFVPRSSMSPAKLLAGGREPIVLHDIKPFDGGLKLLSTLALESSYNPLIDDEGLRAAELAHALVYLDSEAKSASHAKRITTRNTWSQLGAIPLARNPGSTDRLSTHSSGSGNASDDSADDEKLAARL
jgi:hypothetical protein